MSADMTIEEFCSRHRACSEGREWALANCATMRDVWDSAGPEWLVWVARRPGVLSHTELHLLATWWVPGAARYATRAAALYARAAWLRENTKPDFSRRAEA